MQPDAAGGVDVTHFFAIWTVRPLRISRRRLVFRPLSIGVEHQNQVLSARIKNRRCGAGFRRLIQFTPALSSGS